MENPINKLEDESNYDELEWEEKPKNEYEIEMDTDDSVYQNEIKIEDKKSFIEPEIQPKRKKSFHKERKEE